MIEELNAMPDMHTQASLHPTNLDAEKAVLGSLLLNPEALVDVEHVLKQSYFTQEAHQAIFASMARLRDRGLEPDPISLIDDLTAQEKVGVMGGVPYLDYLTQTCPTSVNVLTYARIVERKALLRLLIATADEIKQNAQEGKEDIEQILDKAEQAIFRVSHERSRTRLTPIQDIMPEIMEDLQASHVQEAAPGRLPTGFRALDQLLGGLNKNDLLVLAGRPGMGKSSFGLSIAHHVAINLKTTIAIFSLEMGAEQLGQRLLAMEANTDLHHLRVGRLDERQWHLIQEVSERLGQTRIFIDDTPGASVSEIRGKARRLHAQEGVDLIMIDYMQLMSGTEGPMSRPRENRQQEITYISSSLKNLARELEVPVLALSQLSRAVEARQDKRPMLQDLRESGSIEQDADIVMFLYRDDYYDEDSMEPNLAELIVAKHRNGSLGKVKFYFHKEQTLFQELDFRNQDLPVE